MNPVSRSVSLLYFFSGLLVGLLIGVSLDKEWTSVVSRFISAGAIIIIAFFWQRIESATQKRYLESWPHHRSRGKWRFILTHYVLIRGTILFMLFAGPMLPSIKLMMSTGIIILASAALLALLLMYLGHEAWTKCEQDYEVQMFRQAAEQSRVAAN